MNTTFTPQKKLPTTSAASETATTDDNGGPSGETRVGEDEMMCNADPTTEEPSNDE